MKTKKTLSLKIVPLCGGNGKETHPWRCSNPITHDFDASQMAYSLAGHILRDKLEQSQKDELGVLKYDDVIVVQGLYDHVEEALERLNVNHSVILSTDLDEFHYSPHQLVIINSDVSHKRIAADVLKGFVSRGGCILSTGRVSHTLLRFAFPFRLHVYANSPKFDTPLYYPVEEFGPFESIQGIKQEIKEGRPVMWQFDHNLMPIMPRHMGPEGVKGMLASHEFNDTHRIAGLVACTFEFARGKVIHCSTPLFFTHCPEDTRLASEYAIDRGCSEETIKMFTEKEKEFPNLNYAAVQAATNSADFIVRTILEHRKKYTN